MPGITARSLTVPVVLAGVLALAPASAVAASGPSSPAVTAPALPPVSLPLPGATVPTSTAPVLPALAGAATAPSAAGLGRVLGPLLAAPGLGRSVSAAVIDPVTGTVLYAQDDARAAVPASAAKVLTAAAALHTLGPQTRLTTRVVQGAHPGEIVLVGGGDVLLAPGRGNPAAVVGHAGLADLADATAAALRAGGTTSVTVRLDDTLFSGPAINGVWLPGDVSGGFVAPVMPVEVIVGVTTPSRPPQPGLPAARLADPAASAAVQFAALLEARGIAVTGRVSRARAPQDAVALATVSSATVADIVEHDLTDSDNTTAEVLARLVAVAAGRPATFAQAGQAVLAQVAGLGVPTTGASMSGGSGLGHGTALPARTVARTLALAAAPDHPELRALLSGLPVAGASGTLEDRFIVASTGGAGVVRAKTGTLTGVGSLAGTLVDADGRLLVFAVLADAVPSMTAGRSALDAVAAGLVACGCR